MFVSEKIIDNITDALEGADFEKETEYLGKKQPALLGYVFSEDFELLTQNEREYLLYLILVVYKSVEKVLGTLPTIHADSLAEAEERNWEILDKVTATRFRDRMTPFFEDSEQEDLLAFVEDALVEDDEDTVITKEGREPIFVAMKTVIDVLT